MDRKTMNPKEPVWKKFLHAIDPFDATAGYTIPHALVFLFALFVAYQVGFKRGVQYDAAYFQQRVILNQLHPPITGYPAVPIPFTVAPPVVSSAFVNPNWLDPVDNQGSVGQCACYTFKHLWDAAFYRLTGKHWHFSCAFWYAVYTAGRGDVGTDAHQMVAIVQAVGGVREIDYHYDSPSPSRILFPVPQSVQILASQHRYPLVFKDISVNDNAGYGAVYAMEDQIANHHRQINFGHPVFTGSNANGDFDVNANQGNMDLPGAGATILGWHDMAIRGFNNNHCWNGTCGYFLAQQNWGPHIGVNCLTGLPDTTNGGCVWVSERFVARFGLSLGYLTFVKNLAPKLPVPPLWQQPSPAIHRLLPPPKFTPLPAQSLGLAQTSGMNWVHDICAKDQFGTNPTGSHCGRYLDLAPSINYWSHARGLNPVGLTAALGAECGFYTTSTRCDRLGGGLDFSFGDCQVTVSTAAQFGLGSGVWDGYLGSNASLVRNTEDIPANCHRLAAAVFQNYARYEAARYCNGAAVWPNLEVAWNAGPGQDCSFLLYPSGQAGYNYYQDFLGWWTYAQHFAISYNIYSQKPFVFPRAAFGKLSPYYCASKGHCGLSWAAQIWLRYRELGQARDYGHFYGRSHGYTLTRFSNGKVLTWPSYHTYKVVVHGRVLHGR